MSSAAARNRLSPLSDAFQRNEYLLQLCLQSTKVKDVDMVQVSNPHLNITFEKQTQGMLVIDAWVDASALDEHNRLDDVYRRGFQFPGTGDGMVFATGNIDLGDTTDDRHRFILCRIGVGRSYVQDDPTAKRVIPPGYDSLYLHTPMDADGDGRVTQEEYEMAATHQGRSASQYRHEYVLLDPMQVIPICQVDFVYIPEDADTRPDCEVCNACVAELYCAADEANLCRQCDEDMHSANLLMKKHKRVPLVTPGAEAELSGAPSLVGPEGGPGLTLSNARSTCPDHPDVDVGFFCLRCHTPVCVHCKMTGNHSTGEAASHKLIPVEEAYKASMETASQVDVVLDKRKATIHSNLQAIDAKVRDVNKNMSTVEEAVYEMLQDTLLQLQEESQRKLSVLMGEELELRRQLEQMDWIESFLLSQQGRLNPVTFLAAWRRHSLLRAELHSQKHPDPRCLVEVQPDIRLVGSVCIEAGQGGSGQAASAPRSPGSKSSKRDKRRSDVMGNYEYMFSDGLVGDNDAGGGGEGGASGPGAGMAGDRDSRLPSGAHEMLANFHQNLSLSSGSEEGMLKGGMGGMHRPGVPSTGAVGGIGGNVWQSPNGKQLGERSPTPAGRATPHSSHTDKQWMSNIRGHMMPSRESTGLSSYSAAGPTPGGVGAVPLPGMGIGMGRESMDSVQGLRGRGVYQAHEGGRGDLGERVPASAPQQTRLPVEFAPYTLNNQAERLRGKVRLQRKDLLFHGSEIMTDPVDAEKLLLCLPLGAGAPTVSLQYATWHLDHMRTTAAMVSSAAEANSPIIILARSGEYVFGGYINEPLHVMKDARDAQEGGFGSPKCFLFSITLDLKLPFHGRKMGHGSLGGGGRHTCVSATQDEIRFGTKDLVIGGDFKGCSSDVDSSYGFGLKPDGIEAKTLMAGEPQFSIDELEVWQVSY